MKAWISVAALVATLAFGASSAEAASSGVAKACAKDVKAFCADVKQGGGKLTACVREHFSDLSTECRTALAKVGALQRACKADAKKLCSDVKPGKGRVAECLQSHAGDLSDGCKEAFAKAEAGGK